MTDQWDRFADSAGRSLAALGYESNVELYQPTEPFVQGEGYDISYPSTPTETVAGEAVPPNAQADTDRGGTTREADLVVLVSETIQTDLDDAGESGEALTRVEIDGDSETYEVQTVEPQFDGLDRVLCSEVDT